MVLVHTLLVVGDDQVRLLLPDDVAYGEAGLLVVRQEAVGVVQYIALPAQQVRKRLGLLQLLRPVLFRRLTGGDALFAGGEGQGGDVPACGGAGGKYAAAGELHVAHMAADG